MSQVTSSFECLSRLFRLIDCLAESDLLLGNLLFVVHCPRMSRDVMPLCTPLLIQNQLFFNDKVVEEGSNFA
jgi:hypothetical protein